jgi:hypothetical protein
VTGKGGPLEDVDWGNFYAAAISWGIAPSEFWQMCPEEWWLIYETKRPRDKANDFAGALTEDDCAELMEFLNG